MLYFQSEKSQKFGKEKSLKTCCHHQHESTFSTVELQQLASIIAMVVNHFFNTNIPVWKIQVKVTVQKVPVISLKL